MSYTRATWALALAERVGSHTNVGAVHVPAPTPYVLAFIVAWTAQETAPGQGAAYNLLNTTQPMPGSTFFNCLRRDTDGICTFGVQNFKNFADGIEANASTLENGLYPHLYPAIRDNDAIALGSISGRPSDGVIADLARWGTHNWQGIIGNIDNRALDKQTFSGSSSTVGGGGGGSGIVTKVGSGQVIPEDSQKGVAQALELIDRASEVSNPFNVKGPQEGLGEQIVDFIDPVAAIGDSVSNVLQWATAVGNNLALNVRGLAIRSLVVIVGFALIAYVFLSVVNVGEMKQKALQGVQLAATAA